MFSKTYQILSTLLFLFTTLNSAFAAVDQQYCPYPCYPPPIGGGNGGGNNPSIGGGNSPPIGGGNNPPIGGGNGGGGNNPPKTTFPPPSQTGYYPSPSSIFPYNPPNPDYYGGGPPAPDPIVPWFPFYYKKPPHSTDQPSSTGSRTRSTVVIFSINYLVLSLLLLVD